MSKDLQFTFRRACLELSGEIGSLAELIGYMQEESTALTMAFGDDMELVVQRINGGHPAPAAETSPTSVHPDKPKRGRPAKAAVEAVAPDPLPVPTAPPPPILVAPTATTALPPNALNGPIDTSIPAFLDASQRQAAPPPLPTAPPVSTLGPKIVKALDLLTKGQPDGGQAMSDWLAASGLTIKGKSYDEACRALLMISDERLKDVAGALGVS